MQSEQINKQPINKQNIIETNALLNKKEVFSWRDENSAEVNMKVFRRRKKYSSTYSQKLENEENKLSEKEYIQKLIKEIRESGIIKQNAIDEKAVLDVEGAGLDKKQLKELEKNRLKKREAVLKEYNIVDKEENSNLINIFLGHQKYLDEAKEIKNEPFEDLERLPVLFSKEYVAKNYFAARVELNKVINLAYKNPGNKTYLDLAHKCKDSFESALKANGLKIEYGTNDKLEIISEDYKNEATEKNEAHVDDLTLFLANNAYLQKKKKVIDIVKQYRKGTYDGNIKQYLDVMVEKRKQEKKESVYSYILNKKDNLPDEVLFEYYPLTDAIIRRVKRLEYLIENSYITLDVLNMFSAKEKLNEVEEIQKLKTENRIKAFNEEIEVLKKIVDELSANNRISKESHKVLKEHGLNERETVNIENDMQKYYRTSINDSKIKSYNNEEIFKLSSGISENISDDKLYEKRNEIFEAARYIKNVGIEKFNDKFLDEYTAKKILALERKTRAVMILKAYFSNAEISPNLTEDEKKNIKKFNRSGYYSYAKKEYITASKQLDNLGDDYINYIRENGKWKDVDLNPEDAEYSDEENVQYFSEIKEKHSNVEYNVRKTKNEIEGFDRRKSVLEEEMKPLQLEKDKLINSKKDKLEEYNKVDVREFNRIKTQLEEIDAQIENCDKLMNQKQEEISDLKLILADKEKYLEDCKKDAEELRIKLFFKNESNYEKLKYYTDDEKKLIYDLANKTISLEDNKKIREASRKLSSELRSHYGDLVEKYSLQFPSLEKIEKDYNEIIEDCNRAIFENQFIFELDLDFERPAANTLIAYTTYFSSLRDFAIECKNTINSEGGIKEYKSLHDKYYEKLYEEINTIKKHLGEE